MVKLDDARTAPKPTVGHGVSAILTMLETCGEKQHANMLVPGENESTACHKKSLMRSVSSKGSVALYATLMRVT